MLAAGTLQTWQRIDTLALPLAVDVGDRCGEACLYVPSLSPGRPGIRLSQGSGEASDYVPDRRRFFHLLHFLRSLG